MDKFDVLEIVKNKCKESDVKLIYLTKFGSKLYGTSTPQSDTDYKGIFLPSVESLLLGKAPHNLSFSTKSSNKAEKNTKEDVDGELYSLHKFLDLLKKGDTNAISILYSFTNPIAAEYNSNWMKNLSSYDLVANNLAGMAGYVKSQVYKYSLKGLKYNIVSLILNDFQAAMNGRMKLHEFLDDFGGAEKYFDLVQHEFKQDISNYLSVTKISNPDDTVGYYLSVLEVKLNFNEILDRHIKVLSTLINKFGNRAKQAAEDGFADRKAIYHAFRVLYEIQELHYTGRIQYPIRNLNFLMEIREGKHNLEDLAPKLEQELSKCRFLEKNSLLPNKVSGNLHDEIILNNYNVNILMGGTRMVFLKNTRLNT